MEGLRMFCLTAFDIISIVGQKYSSYKKVLCTNILRFHLLIFGFFSFIFFFYLATTSQSPFSTVPKCVQPEFPILRVDPCAWMDPEGSQPCPAAELCICVL